MEGCKWKNLKDCCKSFYRINNCMRSRAERIHFRNNAEKRASRHVYLKDIVGEDVKERLIKKHRDTPAKCSCSMCRNPRRNEWAKGKDKKTLQERSIEELSKIDVDRD